VAARTKKTQDALLSRILASGTEVLDETGERILEAAAGQAEDFGLRRFTMDDVARRVGVSRVTVYRYFPRKDRLVEAVLMHELRRFLAAVDAAVEPYETVEERLVEGFVFTLTLLRKHRLLNRLLRTEPELILPSLTTKGAPVLEAGREFIARFAHQEAEEGRLALSDEDVQGVSEMLARAVLSFLLTPDSVLGMRTPQEIRRFAEHYLTPILRGLSTSQPGRSPAG
jgi:AcrR family transcriptional regulator